MLGTGEPRSASVIAVMACEVFLLSRAALLAAFQDMSPTAATLLGTAVHWDGEVGVRQHEPSSDSIAPRTEWCHTENVAKWESPSGPPALNSSLQDADVSLAQSNDLLLGTVPDREAAGHMYGSVCATAHEGMADGSQQSSYLSHTQGKSMPMRDMRQALLELRTGEDLCEVQLSLGCAGDGAHVGPEAIERTGASDCYLHAG